jgi:hypothetical protein
MNNKIFSPEKQSILFRFFLALAIVFATFLGSCNSGENIPEVSNVKVDLKTSRFDLDLFAIDTNHIGDGLKKLSAKYPDFLNYFLDTLMAYGIHGNYSDTGLGIRQLDTFLTFKDYVNLEDTIKKYYPGNKDVDKELEDGFRFLKYYMPASHVPRIIYLDMGLSKWASFPLDSTILCVGLDMFLGEQYPFYKSIGVPDYMLTHFRKSYIPVSVFNAVYQTMHPFNADDKTLLDLMIQKGKEQYFLHKILPHKPDSVLFGFKQLQLDWCKNNEALIYNFFIHENLLYNKEAVSIMPYVNDGPFAKRLEAPNEPVKKTPGNIGTWLGYRIVSAYMAEHPKMSLKELLDQQTDAAKFLDETKYRPK